MSPTRLEKTLYWLSTAYVLLLMMWSFFSYQLLYETVSGFFIKFGYPTYIIYPLAYLKLAGAVVILTNKYANLKEWVYGAYYINMILATIAHLSVGDTPYHAYLGMICVPVSYIYSNRVRGRPKQNLFDFWPGKENTPTVNQT